LTTELDAWCCFTFLQRLQGNEVPWNLTVLVTVQEEAGLRGAKVAFSRLQPDLALVVDTRPARGTPDTRSQPALPKLGQGVILSCATSGYLVSLAANHDFMLRRHPSGQTYPHSHQTFMPKVATVSYKCRSPLHL
jgi:putative aminopeptidase FrvX